MAIRNPIEWGWDQLRHAGPTADLRAIVEHSHGPMPEIRRIGLGELWDALVRGAGDFAAVRSDVLFLCLLYPVIGLVLARLVAAGGAWPLLFPLASGFALVGPVAAIGLNEISRRREEGHAVGWADAFGVLRAPALGGIVLLGMILIALFLVWLMAAGAIYSLTLGPEPPASLAAFVAAVFGTAAGWTMIVVGIGTGFCFALVVLAISVVSFPLMLDRPVGMNQAVWTSIRAVSANPGPMAAWGLIVGGGLLLGSIPYLLGLVVVLPVLGHATWHLYRALVVRA